MAIVLTGDVHHTIGSGDQQFIQQSEASLSVSYARIAASYDLKVTLFFTGRAIIEDSEDAKPLLSMDNVEIGGHGWNAFRPRWWHRMMNLLTGSPHGPAPLQRRMIQRTCRTIEQYTRRPVRSWRNHAYRCNQDTPWVLHNAGVVTWSDYVQPEKPGPFRHESGIVVLPINTLPDHENLLHGARTPERVNKEGRESSYSPDVWSNMVRDQIKAIAGDGGIATILAHPICMSIVDNFTTFERLCEFLSHYDSLSAGDVHACIP